MKIWKMSFDMISKQQPRDAEMLSLMACQVGQGIAGIRLRNDSDKQSEQFSELHMIHD